MANTDFADEIFIMKQGGTANKTIHVRKNDANASNIPWQEIYIQAGDDAFSDYWSVVSVTPRLIEFALKIAA